MVHDMSQIEDWRQNLSFSSTFWSTWSGGDRSDGDGASKIRRMISFGAKIAPAMRLKTITHTAPSMKSGQQVILLWITHYHRVAVATPSCEAVETCSILKLF